MWLLFFDTAPSPRLRRSASDDTVAVEQPATDGFGAGPGRAAVPTSSPEGFPEDESTMVDRDGAEKG